jgi:hypothetical protein
MQMDSIRVLLLMMRSLTEMSLSKLLHLALLKKTNLNSAQIRLQQLILQLRRRPVPLVT